MMRAFVGVAAAIVLAGCASVQPGRGFDSVRQDVSERTGQRIHWNNGSPEDDQVRDAVRALLLDELSEDEAVQVALLNNRDLQATYEELNIAQADLVQAGLLRNPLLEAAVRWPTSGTGTGVDLGVAAGFLEVFWIPLRKGRAEAAFEAAKLRVAGEVLRTAGEVQGAYYQTVAAGQQAEMLETVLAALEASYELARRLHAAGNIRDLDLSLERAAYEEAKLGLARARTDTLVLRERLNDLMGVWGESTQWRAAARLGEVPPGGVPEGPELERRAVERSLELAAARRDIEALARGFGMVRADALFDQAEIGAAAEREVEGDWSVGPAVAVPLPLFDQGQARTLRARAELAAAAERMYAIAVRVRARARALGEATRGAAARAEYYRRVVLPLRERIVGEMQLQYNAMQVSPQELLRAKRDHVRAGREYIDALRDYWINRSRLDLLMAGRMGGMGELTRNTEAAAVRGGGYRGH